MRPRHFPSLLLIVACLSSGSGCKGPDTSAAGLLKGDAIGKVTQLQLREELKDFSYRFSFILSSAANEIRTESTDPVMCINAIYWQLFTIPSVRRSAVSQNPVAGLVDIWTYCKQLEDYFEREEAFGERTQIARDVSTQMEADISTIATDIIPVELYEKVEAAIDAFAVENPIAGSFARRSLRPAMVKASDAKSLMWVTDLPLAPFRMFMDDTARSIREFTLVADSLVTYAQTVPDVFRWQLQLLMYDIESRPTTTSILSSFKSASDAVQSLAQVAEALPDQLQKELGETFELADAKQAGVRETLKEIQTTLASAEATLEHAKPVAATLEKTTENWNEAGARWERAVGAADGLVARFTDDEKPTGAATSETAAAENESGFDIKDYTETAIRAEAAVARLRELTAETRSLLESDSASRIVDKVVWSGVILIATFFGFLLLYRFAVLRLGRASNAPQLQGGAASESGRTARAETSRP